MNPMMNHKLGQMTHAEYEGRYAEAASVSTTTPNVMPKVAYLLTFAAIILMPLAL
ncbi:MAG: hypothetical protein AAF614_38525 [Chloroflexota bacterium]